MLCLGANFDLEAGDVHNFSSVSTEVDRLLTLVILDFSGDVFKPLSAPATDAIVPGELLISVIHYWLSHPQLK